MSQFDVFKNAGKTKSIVPFLLDVQSDFVSTVIGTRLVVPVYNAKEIQNPVEMIHIPITVSDKKLIAMFDEVSVIGVKSLGDRVSNLSRSYEDTFKNALEVMLFNLL